MTEPALYQCLLCHKYLAKNRAGFAGFCTRPLHNYGSCNGYPSRNCVGFYNWIDTAQDELCEACVPGGIPLAQLRGTLTDPRLIELFALLGEECAEVIQRLAKIMRWGLDADFEGTTQLDKLLTELGDVFATVVLLQHNKVLDWAAVIAKMDAKLEKFREDAAGPRQRLMHAEVPPV